MDEVRLECSECHLKYDKGKRCPRSLFCGHTFCTHCLDQVIARGSRRCPDCSRPFIALSASQLPTDFNLLKAATSTTTLRTSDPLSYKSKSGTSASTSRVGSTSSTSQDLKSSTSLTSTKRFQLPPIGSNASNYSNSDSRPSSVSATTRSLSGSSGSRLRLSGDPKEPSSLVDRNGKDDVDAPRSTTFSRFSNEELRRSRPPSTLSYELPTIGTPISTGNRESRLSQSSVESNNTVALRPEDSSRTSSTEMPSGDSTEISMRRSGASHRLYASSDEALKRRTSSATGECEPNPTQTRPISSVQLPLTSRVSRIVSQEQRLTSPIPTELDSSSKSPKLSDPVVSTPAPLDSLPRLPKLVTPPRSSVSGISSATKALVDEVDRSISSREREEENLVRGNTGNDAIKSRMKESNTPSHVLKMCRSITTKTRNLSGNDEDSRSAPSSSETHREGRERQPFARGLRQEELDDSENNIPPNRYDSRRDPGPSRSPRAYLTSANLINPSDNDDKADGEQKESSSDSENRDPRATRHQPTSDLYSPLTRVRETASTQRRPSVPLAGSTETTQRDEVHESSREKWKMTESFNKENIDTTSSHHIGRIFRTSDKTRRIDRSLSTSLNDLSGSKTRSEARSLSPERVLTRSRSTGLESFNDSENGKSSSSSREVGRLARSSTLSARLSARTGFISRVIKEENEENLKENLSSTEEKYGKPSKEFEEELKPTHRSSLSARLKSRTSFLSRTTSAEEEDITKRRRLVRDQGGGGGAPNGESTTPDPGVRLTSSWAKTRRTKSEDHTLTSPRSDGSIHSFDEREEKIKQIENHKSKTHTVDRGCTDVTPDSPSIAPSLPLSPPPSTNSSSSICPSLTERSTEDRQDDEVSDHQTDENESTASDGESWDSTRENKPRNNKISGTTTNNPSTTSDEPASHSRPSLPGGKYKKEPKSLSHRERWRRHQSVDSESEDEIPNAKTSHRVSKREGLTSQERSSSTLESSLLSSASSWRCKSSPSSHPSYQSPLAGKSQRTTGMDSKSSLSPYDEDSSQARVTEGDSGVKQSSQLPTNINTSDTTSAERSSGANEEEPRLHRPLSSTGQSPRFRTWQNRFGQTTEDSKRALDDGCDSHVPNISENRSVSSLPQTAIDSARHHRRADAGGHDQRPTSSWRSAIQASTQKGKLSDPGKERSPSEDGSEDTDTEDSEDTPHHRWRTSGTHRETLGYNTHTSSVHQRTNQGATSNNTLYRKTLDTEGDKINTQLAKTIKETANGEQYRDSKITKDKGVDDSSTGSGGSTSRPRLTRTDPRLRSPDEFVTLQTNSTPVGKIQETSPSRPITKSSVQDIWRARNAKNRNYLAARARQTGNATANEAPGEAGTSEARVQDRQAPYQLQDVLSTGTDPGGSQPHSSSLRLSFLRSNLQGKTEEEKEELPNSVSTPASQHQTLPQSRQSQRDDDAVRGAGSPANQVIDDAGRVGLNPIKHRDTGQDHQCPQSKSPEDEQDIDETEAQTTAINDMKLTEGDMKMTEVISQGLSFLHSSELETDSVDGPHIMAVPRSSSNRLRLANRSFLEMDLDTSQTKSTRLSGFQQEPNLTYSSPTGSFSTKHTGGGRAPLIEEMRDSPQVTSSRFESEVNTRPNLTSPTPEAPPGVGSCSTHGSLLHLYCKRCEEWVCDDCLDLLHQSPPQGGCQVISAKEAVVHMKMAHSEFLTSRVNALDHFREELIKLLTECEESIGEHDANINQMNFKIMEEERLLKGTEAMKSLALQKLNQIDYWEDVLQKNATRINQSSSSQEIVSAVQANRSTILANIMGGLALPEFSSFGQGAT